MPSLSSSISIVDVSDGLRGTGLYHITTAPTAYTTTTGGFKPAYRIALSTVLDQSGADDILIGDLLEYSYYHYPVGYVDGTYVYLGAAVSIRGASGSAGANSAQVVLYKRGASAPAKPSGNVTYTFATGSVTGTLDGWTKEVPSGSDPVWAITASASSTGTSDTIASSEWSTQVKVFEDGTPGGAGSDGLNQATIFLYQRAASAPAKPTATPTYTFSTGALSAVPSGWSRNIPTGTNPCYVTTAAAISANANVAISGWSDVVKLVEDGTSVTITSKSITYQKGTSGTTAPTGSWGTSVPSVGEGQYLWTKTVVTYSDGTSTEAYSVSRNATNGINGTSPTVTSTVVEYQQSSAGTTPPTGEWSSTAPSATAGYYMWTRTTITYSDSATAVSYSVGKNGTNGANATAYWLIVSDAAVVKSASGAYTPSTITLTAKSQTGTAAAANYTGRLVIETYHGRGRTENRVNTDAATTTYTIPSGVTQIRCSLYVKGAKTTLLDQQIVPVVTDGTNGNDGKDAYTVILTNESHTFPGTATAAVANSTATCGIVTYKGATQVACWTGASSSATTLDTGVTGLTCAIANNNSTSVTLTFTAASTLTTGGTVSIPVTVTADSKKFTKLFTFSVSFAGDQGYSIVAYVTRDAFTEANWNTYGTIGHAEGWTGTESIRNGCRIGDLFAVVGTSTDGGKAHTAIYRSTTNSGALRGECIAHTYADKGDKGDAGGRWYSGTAITGTSTTATIFSGSGITAAVVGDMYLNTSTYNTYRCTVAGAASVAKWVYVNNIKGGKGDQGQYATEVVTEYYLSTSNTGQSGGSWGTTPAAYVSGRYYWRRDKITWTNPANTTYTTAVLDNALNSANSTATTAKTTADSAVNAAGGFTIIWDKNAGTSYAGGEAGICGYDPTTGVISPSSAGWVIWKNVKRTIPYAEINPNTMCPYNIPIYVVARLGTLASPDVTSTTAVSTLVWYNSGWKYISTGVSASTSGAAVADWTWDANEADMVIGKFVEPASEAVFTETELYNPPWTYKSVTSNTTTALSAQATANNAAPKGSAIAREQRIYYRKTASGAPAKNTTWLATSGTGYGNWSLRIPQMTSGTTKYPYLYTAVQTQTVAQMAAGTACTCSDVLLDDTTTVIDGGTIITGSVNANAVNASSGTFNTANIPNLDASKITTGTLNADRIAANSLTLGKMTTETQAAIDNSAIQIGGKNLIGGTDNNTPTKLDGSDAANTFGTVGAYNTGISSISTEVYDSSSYAVTATETGTGNRGAGWYTNPGVVAYGDTVTFSCMVKASLATTVHTHTAWRRGSATGAYTGWTSAGNKSIAADTWTEYSYTFTCASAYPAYEFYVALCFTGNSSGLTWKIAHAKLERGNKATDWTPAPEDTIDYIDSIQVGGRNLIGRFNIIKQGSPTTYSESNYTWKVSGGSGYGLMFPHTLFEKDKTYCLSFKFQKTAGQLTAIGGHCSDFVESKFLVDGSAVTRTYFQGHIMSDDTNTHNVVVLLRCTKTTSDGNLYIQPNRGSYISDANGVTLKIWDLMLEESTTPSSWSPAPEDVDSAIAAVDAQSVEYIVGTQTAATGTWTGVTKDTSLVAGKTIAYKLPYAGSGNASLTLKLATGSNTANIPVYLSTTRVTTHFGAGSVIQMTYDGANWRASSIPNTNNYDRRLHNTYIKAASNVASGALACGTASGYKQVAASVAFDLSYPILWAGAAWTSGTQYANGYEAYPSINPGTTATVQSIAVNKIVYLKGKVSGNTFTIAASNFLTCAIPASEDGFAYMPIGVVSNDSTSKVYFSSPKDLYAYVDGAFGPISIREASAAAKTATNYLHFDASNGLDVGYTGTNAKTNISGSGVKIYAADNTNHADINSDGMQVFKSGSQVASFGEKAVLGTEGKTRQELDYHSMVLYDKEGNQYFYVSDLRDDSGIAVVQNRFIGDGSTKNFVLANKKTAISSVTINGTATTAYTVTDSNVDSTIKFTTAPANGASIIVVFTTSSVYAKAYTFGIRQSGSNVIGAMSVAEGFNVRASGYASHAEGESNAADGRNAHAEGWETMATGENSHSEGENNVSSGNNSHVEGCGSVASGNESHAEGYHTTASGQFSHAQNEGTIASAYAQTAIGSYNVSDNTSALIIGNGTSSSRSNALTVSKQGELRAAIGAHGPYIQLKGKLSSEVAGTGITKVTLTNSGVTDYLNNTDFTLSNGGIMVNKAGLYRVSGSINITPGAASNFSGVYICVDTVGTSIHSALYYNGTTRTREVQCAPKLVTLTSGQVLYLCSRSLGTAGTVEGSHNSTYLLIERIS